MNISSFIFGKKALTLFVFLLLSLVLFSQVTNYEYIDGEKFVLHRVAKGETLFSICRQYSCDQKELVAANPQLVSGLNIDQVLRIPFRESHANTLSSEKENGTTRNSEFLQEGVSKSITESRSEAIDFFLHRVEPGETFYSFQRRFGVGHEELVEWNPALQDGLKTGLLIKIPHKKEEQKVSLVTVPEGMIRYETQAGDNLFRIAIENQTTVFLLKEMNPELKNRNLIAGETILIPANPLPDSVQYEVLLQNESIKKTEKPPLPVPMNRERKNAFTEEDTLHITLLLPLYYDINDSLNREILAPEERALYDSLALYEPGFQYPDTLRSQKERTLFHPTRNILSFFEGFLIAADSLSQKGFNIHVDLIDTGSDSLNMDRIIAGGSLLSTDLIVGPVDPVKQKPISEFAFKNHIPMVSPFAGENNYIASNPYYFQVNPSRNYLMKKTADFIGDHYFHKNFLIMTLGGVDSLPEKKLVSMVRDKFFFSGMQPKSDQVLYTQVDFLEGGNLGYWQVKRSLKPDQENVLFIPATNRRNEREALLSRAINSLYVLSEEFDITLIGMSDYPGFKSINTEYFHRLNLHFLTPNHIDYSREEVYNFLQAYRKRFLTEPNQYSFRGYDIALFFIQAFQKYGRNFVEQPELYNDHTLQSVFDFRKTGEFSGLMNHTLYLVHYTPEYDVHVVSRMSE